MQSTIINVGTMNVTTHLPLCVHLSIGIVYMLNTEEVTIQYILYDIRFTYYKTLSILHFIIIINKSNPNME